MRREQQDRYEVESTTVSFSDGDVTVHTITDRRTGQKMFVSDSGKDKAIEQSEIDLVFRIYYQSRERREDNARRGRRIRIRRRKK